LNKRGEIKKMENHEAQPYRTTFPVDEIERMIYEYRKKKEKENPTRGGYQGLENKSYGLTDLLKADERVIEEEVESIEHQIAEREKIKQRNITFLEDQRKKLEEFLNRTECFTYKPMGIINAVRSKLMTQLVQVELKKGEEYVNAFRDVQRLEAEKRELLSEERADEGGSGWS